MTDTAENQLTYAATQIQRCLALMPADHPYRARVHDLYSEALILATLLPGKDDEAVVRPLIEDMLRESPL